jgi:TPR repeat protein
MYNFGIGLENGFLGNKDKKGAMFWHKKAAELGYVDAIYRYGIGLEYGYLGTSDKKGAMFWYKKAADLGHSQARSRLQ